MEGISTFFGMLLFSSEGSGIDRVVSIGQIGATRQQEFMNWYMKCANFLMLPTDLWILLLYGSSAFPPLAFVKGCM